VTRRRRKGRPRQGLALDAANVGRSFRLVTSAAAALLTSSSWSDDRPLAFGSRVRQGTAVSASTACREPLAMAPKGTGAYARRQKCQCCVTD